MVHALEVIHNLLEPGGWLLDIHPSGDPPRIEVRLGDRNHLAGWMRESDDYIEYAQADQALAEVVECGLFTLEKSGTFPFNTYADSIDELRSYLAETWQDAIVDDQVARRVEDLLRSLEADKEVVLREVVKISHLRPLWAGEENN
jgi:hypothetical protein